MSNHQDSPLSISEKWFSAKEAESLRVVKRGRKRSQVDEAKRAQAANELQKAYHKIKSWQGVGNHYGISKAAAYRIANDKTYRPSQYMLDAVIEKVTAQPLPRPPRHRRRYYRPCLSLELRDELERRGADPEMLLWAAMRIEDRAVRP